MDRPVTTAADAGVSTPRPSALIDVSNLTAGYGRHQVLHGVDLVVPAGAFVGLLGHNGAGKSTMLQTVTGHLRAGAGVVTFNGQDITASSTTSIARSGLGYVPQGHAVFPSLTIRENLNIGGALQSDRAAREDRESFVLDLFPILKDRFPQKAGSLSGGQRQMLAIAMSLASSPRVMLMDEPSTGLAPVLAAEVLAACKRINHELGTAVVVVEADIKRILDLADHVYVLKLGSIVFDGTPEELGDRDFSELF